MIKFLEEIEISEYTNENSFVESEGVLYFISEELSDSQCTGIKLTENGDSYDIQALLLLRDEDMKTITGTYDGLSYAGKESAYREFFRYLSYDSSLEISEDIIPEISPYFETGDYYSEENVFTWKFLEIFEITGEATPGFYDGSLMLTNVRLVNTTNEEDVKMYKDISLSSSFYIDDEDLEYSEEGEIEVIHSAIEAYFDQLSHQEALEIVERITTQI